MILLRTHMFGDRERRLTERLAAIPGRSVAVAADETRRTLDVGPFAKVSVTRAACIGLGLYCPKDFAWRNGDYALYLARRQFPDEHFFWLIEPDVEHSFSSDPLMFDYFDAHAELDLLATYLTASTAGWWWAQTARPHPTGVRRALFCLLRISARALDVCLNARRQGRWSLRDRLFWPNDEAFVATEVAHAGLRLADMNDVGKQVYDHESFGYEDPLLGDDGSFRSTPNRIFHPVLYGSEHAARLARIERAEQTVTVAERARRKLQRSLNQVYGEIASVPRR